MTQKHDLKLQGWLVRLVVAIAAEDEALGLGAGDAEVRLERVADGVGRAQLRDGHGAADARRRDPELRADDARLRRPREFANNKLAPEGLAPPPLRLGVKVATRRRVVVEARPVGAAPAEPRRPRPAAEPLQLPVISALDLRYLVDQAVRRR